MESSAVIVKQEYEKLPKIISGRNDENSYNCIVPMIETKFEAIKDDNAKKFNKSVPDDLILALKQAEIPKEFLGPPSKKSFQNSKPANPSILKRPDNAWNYEKQREKFKFLTDQPICSCGAGKDISFIYDCSLHKPINKPPPISKYDTSSVRASEPSIEKSIQLSETLIPDEFRVVKNQGVWPLKVEEQQYATLPEDHMNHLTLFPSLKPTGRNEVIQLKHTMEALLKRVGADIIDQKGPTQLHNLLEIIKKEQDIYNIVFHEVIRQVTVECKDRGEILARLRERYANLLSRVPREIKSLHEEIIAQRALDRRLTEELMKFKSTISYLTDELSYVKQHDKSISDQAGIYQRDLEQALNEAQKNASLLKEYHELYELQRKRLEKTISSLIEERDVWTNASYSIALKVANENKLITAKRLNVAQKEWSKLAKHFSLMLNDRDNKDLAEVQKLTDTWKTTVEDVRNDLNAKEIETKKCLDIIRSDVDKLKNILTPSILDEKGRLIQDPDRKKISMLTNQIRRILDLSIKESETYAGESIMQIEENIRKADRTVFSLVQLCGKLLSRHYPSKEKEKVEKYTKYEKLQVDMKILHEQFKNRTSGENGLLKNIISLNNGLDVYLQKFYAQMLHEQNGKNKIKLSEGEWQSFYQSIDDWIEIIQKSLSLIGWPIKEPTAVQQLDSEGKPILPKIISQEDLFNELNKWLSAISEFIDTQNACIVDEVSNNNSKMIYWMVIALTRLAPDREKLSEEAKKIIYNPSSSVETLTNEANDLIPVIENFTNNLVFHSKSLATEGEVETLADPNDKTEKESKKLVRFQNDCQEWVYTVKLLIAELNGDKTHRGNVSDRLTYAKMSVDDQESESILNDKKSSSQSDRLKRSQDMNKSKSDLNDIETTTNVDISQEFDNKTETNTMFLEERSASDILGKNINSFEILASDANTQRKFLDNINFNDSNHLTEVELKSTVFNALKTIEKLQGELITTEERAQKAEATVADLDLKLKQALERIRKLEKPI